MSIDKVERFNCCSMDVHKDTLVATSGITDRSTLITQYIQETFNSFNSDLCFYYQLLV